MCDQDHCRCQSHRHSRLCDHSDHCHFEQYQQETRGPLHHTSTSTLRGCHRPNHNPSQWCDSGTRCCDRTSHRNCCNNHCQERSILYDLEGLFGQRRRDSDLANILDSICRNQPNNTDSHNNNNNGNRGVLRQLLDELLGSSSNSNSNTNNRNNRSSNTSSSSDRDVLVDLLLRITSNSNTSTNTITTNLDNPPPYYPHYAGRRLDDLTTNPHFVHLQNAWLARNAASAAVLLTVDGFPLHYSYSQPNLSMCGLGMSVPTMATPWAAVYASRGQVPPRWLGGR